MTRLPTIDSTKQKEFTSNTSVKDGTNGKALWNLGKEKLCPTRIGNTVVTKIPFEENLLAV